MAVNVRLGEIIPADMIETHREHIVDFLLMEGITPHAGDLADTELSERKIKELLTELADDMAS